MDREEILRKIEEIRGEVEKDQLKTLRSKILERRFHFHGSHRNWVSRFILQKIRKRLILEMSLILQPILDNQKEINLRFLKEIERLKESVSSGQSDETEKGKDAQGPTE
ncbi:MAG: hypothetical protein QHH14_06020 [Clostridiales bacterium]|nr:hypothetical protein [Clostridiales bacterium]